MVSVTTVRLVGVDGVFIYSNLNNVLSDILSITIAVLFLYILHSVSAYTKIPFDISNKSPYNLVESSKTIAIGPLSIPLMS